jgi:hypothetical protein
MKKILTVFLVALVVMPFVGFASSPVQNNHPAASTCTNFEQCPEYRDYLLNLLAELIKIVEELQKAQAASEIEIDENGIVTDIDSEDLSELKDVTYTILSEGRLSGESRGDVPDVIIDIWSDFEAIASAEIVDKYVSSLRAYYNEEDIVAAYVETDDNDYTKWVVGINISAYQEDQTVDKKNFHQTLVHEFAHIVTLNEEQLDLTTPSSACGIYYMGEGCLYANSYLAEFVKEFWDDKDFDHAEEYEDESDEDEQQELIEDFFQENNDEYVTEYATTQPAEDIAESFVAYISEELPEDDQDERDEKILFFDNFPELREIRERIRSAFITIYN